MNARGSDAIGSDDEILGELVQLAREDGARQLLQFEARISADQYRGLYAAVRHHVPAGAHVLDWGPGNGHFSYFLLRAGYRASAFGLDPPGVAAWLTDNGWHFVEGTPDEPTQLPFDDGCFDAVSSIGVLEHVHERGGRDTESLAELVRVLRAGGTLVCCHLPNQGSWIEALADRIGGHHHHDVRYTPAQVRQLFTDAGLEILEQRRYGFLPRNAWARVPAFLADAAWVRWCWNALDEALERGFARWTQNHLVIARKRATVSR